MTRSIPRIGSVSTGTNNPRELIPTFMDALERFGGTIPSDAVFPQFMDIPEGPAPNYGYSWSDPDSAEFAAYLESDDASDDVAALVDALNAVSPDYVYFGAHPGDGADYGFWPSWDAIESDSITVDRYRKDPDGNSWGILRVSDFDAVPWGYVGTVLLVNDHGNATCYACFPNNGGRGRTFQEIWSCV